jgi:hypothetical protein
MINKEIIAQRKEQYGNNFPKLAELINNYLSNFKNDGEPILPEDAAIIMALMKVSRLNESPSNEDSMQDLFNYMYIAINYKEYEEIT